MLKGGLDAGAARALLEQCGGRLAQAIQAAEGGRR